MVLDEEPNDPTVHEPRFVFTAITGANESPAGTVLFITTALFLPLIHEPLPPPYINLIYALFYILFSF